MAWQMILNGVPRGRPQKFKLLKENETFHFTNKEKSRKFVFVMQVVFHPISL